MLEEKIELSEDAIAALELICFYTVDCPNAKDAKDICMLTDKFTESKKHDLDLYQFVSACCELVKDEMIQAKRIADTESHTISIGFTPTAKGKEYRAERDVNSD